MHQHPLRFSGHPLRGAEAGRRRIREHCGSYTSHLASGLVLRHDNASQYTASYFQQELRFLRIESSPAYVREPEGYGAAERSIRCLKEQLLWVRHLETMTELERGPHPFTQRYNQQWLVSKHDYRTPHQARAMLALEPAA